MPNRQRKTHLTKDDTSSLEIRLLLEGIYERYGYDFRDYAPASLKRRIIKSVHDLKSRTIAGLLEMVLYDPHVMDQMLNILSVDVTTMFRDPMFFSAVWEKVLPVLGDYPLIRIWHAGCSSGEEVYSLAIALQEADLLSKSRIYATDINQALLKRAAEGIFPLAKMKDCSRNYQLAGGKRSFSAYYTAKYDNAKFRQSLVDRVVWGRHNLVTDSSFNEFHFILCRNVMIYFNKSLSDRVHNLLYDSLAISGFLALGSKESLKFTPHEAQYVEIDSREKIYRRAK